MIPLEIIISIISLASGGEVLPPDTISKDGWIAIASIIATIGTLAGAFMVHQRSVYSEMGREIKRLRLMQNIDKRKLEKRAEYLEDQNEALRDHIDVIEDAFYRGEKGPLPKIRKVERPHEEDITVTSSSVFTPSIKELENELARLQTDEPPKKGKPTKG